MHFKEITLGFLLLASLSLTSVTGLDDGGSKSGNTLQDGANNLFEALSIEAQQTLLDIRTSLSIGNLIGDPMPLYRRDLKQNYIAYWELTFETGEFIIISAGPDTGDARIIHQGIEPRTEQMNDIAKTVGATCTRYYVVNFVADLMCEDSSGTLVATTLRPELVLLEPDIPDIQQVLLEKILEEDAASMWEKRAKDKASEWKDQRVMTEDELNDYYQMIKDVQKAISEGQDVDVKVLKRKYSMTEIELSKGDDVQIALSDRGHFRYVEIVERSFETEKQKSLCHIAKICEGDSPRVSEDWIHNDHETGLLVLKFSFPDDIDLDSSEIDFAIVIHRGQDEVVLRLYGLELNKKAKRAKNKYYSWSGWNYYHIPCPETFPEYNQHIYGRCYVGCAPVAWAMVFGYMDRASHRGCRWPQSLGENLWTCGPLGYTGLTNCSAPCDMTDVVEQYTERLNDLMGTFCIGIGGGTYSHQMVNSNMQTFYTARHLGTSPSLTYKAEGSTDSNGFANWTRDKIRAGYPVVIGYMVSTNAGHAPVVTGYRWKNRKVKRCNWLLCYRTWYEYQYEMKLNMGWGGSGNGFYPMDLYFSQAAI